ncbi:hypothetical protein [Micromonospora sp. M51]|nr:hypothetical protein [Micromonospora sp. M51]
MPDIPPQFRARVRHEPDRSYAVLVEGRQGAARLFGVPLDQIAR